MHFGEYLVQQKILSAHQILKALAEQRRRRRFIPLLLVELDILPDYQVLHYCTQEDYSDDDFLDILAREGIVTQQSCELIRSAWMRSGPPLGRLLVEMGFMDNETREEILEEFEAEKSLIANLAKLT